MRRTNFPIKTLKEVPSEAEIVSHQLMLRSGLVKRLASGLYTWLPLGLKVLRKVETIIREEMNRAGALELLMPLVQPAELWRESGRWEEYGSELLRLNDRNSREFCLGPTHEEVITDIARNEFSSYRQLPVNYYQIQTKFRDETRPRFGIMRAREFTMKDAYSFHLDQESLLEGYASMRATYDRIFTRLQLEFKIVQANPGEMGGNRSEEFHVLAASGEDAIAYCEADGFAANVETVTLAATTEQSNDGAATDPELLTTPDIRSIEELCAFLNVKPKDCLKALLVAGSDTPAVVLLLRGDHELNCIKAEAIEAIAKPLRMLSEAEIISVTGCEPGFLGPIDLKIPVYADHSVACLRNFVCGANKAGHHFRGVNWKHDFPLPQLADLRNAVSGDPSPSGGGPLTITRGIEVGHIFQLGSKYSDSMDTTVLDNDGKTRPIQMGCYGIGVTRVVAAAIEQNNDERGIIWPEAIAPFDIVLIPINLNKSYRIKEAADSIYAELRKAGFDVLLDDRAQRPGVKFADADLLGIPHRLVIAEKTWDEGRIEYKKRRSQETEMIAIDNLLTHLSQRSQLR